MNLRPFSARPHSLRESAVGEAMTCDPVIPAESPAGSAAEELRPSRDAGAAAATAPGGSI